MSIVTSQQLTRYYEQFKATDVTFNKQVIAAVGLVARGVYLKVLDRQLPCMVFSSSMSSARVIANIPPSIMTALKQANNRLALRWCFKLPDKVEPITFFVTCHPTGFTHYAVQGPEVQFVALQFTQRPPDDLIQILGSLLEAKANSQQRRDERIVLNPEAMKKLGMESREGLLVTEGRVIKCLLRDLSFSGAKVVLSAAPGSFQGKAVTLRFAPSEQVSELSIPASVLRVEEVGGRSDILAVSMAYATDPPMSYKLMINAYISTIRKAAPDAPPPKASGPSGEPAAGAPTASPPQAQEVPAANAAPAPDGSAIPAEADPGGEADGKDPG